MKFFQHLPIKHKLLSIILASVVFALLLLAVGLVAADIFQFRRSMPRDLQILTRIVADNAESPLAFSDPTFAEETLLASLSAHPRITKAVVYDAQGNKFAEYARSSDIIDTPSLPEQATGHEFTNGSLNAYETVSDDNGSLGTVFVQSDLQDLHARMWTAIRVTGSVLLFALGGAIALSLWLQRFIARPVEALATTAQKVVDQSDYSLRAKRYGADELGIFTDTFNSMLSHIEGQALELADSRLTLETIINSINGIVWECDAENLRFTFVSKQSESLLGFSVDDWTSDPSFWASTLHPDDAEQAIAQCKEHLAAGKPYQYDYRMVAADGRVIWILESGSVATGSDGKRIVRGTFVDITAQKSAEEELEKANRDLVEASRTAGMAEIATGVLHNVGNVLNTVNLTAGEIWDRLDQTRIGHLRQAVTLINEQNGNLADFMLSDPRGKALPGFLTKVTDHLENENEVMRRNAGKLVDHVEHIKEIVSTQQSYAKVMGVVESISPCELIDSAIKLVWVSYDRHDIPIVKELSDLPSIPVDRHKIVQILVNLLNNAKDAIKDSEGADCQVIVRAMPTEGADIAISVTDSGVGISPENLKSIFQHGFTTKPSGHGFGLHSSALAAGEMGGSLSVSSAGIGHGATFTLKLPAKERALSYEN